MILAMVGALLSMLLVSVLLAPAPTVDESSNDDRDESETDRQTNGCRGRYFAVMRITRVVVVRRLVMVVEARHVEDGEDHDEALRVFWIIKHWLRKCLVCFNSTESLRINSLRS